MVANLPGAPRLFPSATGWEKIVAVRYFLGLLVAVVVVAGATKVGYDRFQDEVETRTSSATSLPPVTGTTLPDVLPSADQVVVVGTVASVHLETALLEPLATPLTVTTPERGLTSSGTFTGVTVDGADASIHWDAGTPLQLGGAGGSIAPGAVTVDVDGSNTVVTFDEQPQGITAGSYTIGSPVAVSAGSGLATPRDSVAFEATPTATVTFTGGATITRPTQALTARGPGKVVLTGSLTVVRPDGSQATVTTITLPAGPFTVEVTPDPAGLKVKATLQGPVTTS